MNHLIRSHVATRVVALIGVGTAVVATTVIGTVGAAPGEEPQGPDAITCPTQPVQLPGRDLTVPGALDQTSQSDLACANLAGADLHGLDFTQADLRVANLLCADLRGERLGQARMRGSDLR